MRTIYCLELENERFFLYSKAIPTSNAIELFLEAVLTYEYVRQNKPLSIKWSNTAHTILHLDQQVKEQMLLYGIDRVRGGSYSEPILTPEQRAFLTVELQGPLEPFPSEVTKDIIAKYSCVHLSDSEYKKERARLIEERARFQSEYAVLADLRHIDIPKIRADIDWLLYFCSELVDVFPRYGLWNPMQIHMITRYNSILPKLGIIYSFMTLSGKPFNNTIHIKYPQFLLDEFFYGAWNSPTYPKIDRVRQICEAYQTFVTTWENRLAEAEFDVASWGPNAAERFSCALSMMDLFIQK